MSLIISVRNFFAKRKAEKLPCKEVYISGIFVHNDVVALNDVCVTQSVTGNIYCTKKVTVCKDAQVIGNIFCRQGVVEGSVTGDISAFEMLEVKATAVLNGDINARKLNVSPAATLNGYITSITLKVGKRIYSDIKLKIDKIKYQDIKTEDVAPEIINFDNFKSTAEELDLNEEPNLINEVASFNFQPEKIEEAAIGDNNEKWW
jgi:cytoskeletal protein CcmA (bactofilin family)